MSNLGLSVSEHSPEKKSISVLTTSGDSLRSKRKGHGIRDTALIVLSLCLLVAVAVYWCFRYGYILYWGDAQAHLNISRSIFDSRTPGYDQLGTVWLPLLHVFCLPLVRSNFLWTTGLAGSIPVAVCFVIAGVCFYFAAKDAYQSSLAAAVVLACFALNPNVLYLASIPMTEVVFLAGLALLLLTLFRFRRTQNSKWILLGVLASWAMSLTRYDGWFLIPFSAVAFSMFARGSAQMRLRPTPEPSRDREGAVFHKSGKRPWAILVTFAALAALAPLYWLAHNWWETGNALDFYNGPYSAVAIQGDKPYPGYHDWAVAIQYYSKAGQLCAGWWLVLLGGVGILCAVKKKVLAPILFLMLTPLFYVWSIHSSKNPIHVPQLWPHGYYNTRYGIAVVPLAAFAVGAIVLALPARWKKLALVLPLICLTPWLLRPSAENWICWKESQYNSVSRRGWTDAGAQFLMANYRAGQGILTFSATDDVSGIFRQARIPLNETLNIGNGPAWLANLSRPDLLHQELWVVAQEGDLVSAAMSPARSPKYRMVQEIQVKGAPPLQIYRRQAK